MNTNQESNLRAKRQRPLELVHSELALTFSIKVCRLMPKTCAEPGTHDSS